MLSLCETCKYMGLGFLDFLRSGKKDTPCLAKMKSGLKYIQRGDVTLCDVFCGWRNYNSPATGPVWDVESGGTVCVLVADCQWPQSGACLKPETMTVTFEEFSSAHDFFDYRGCGSDNL